MMNKRFLTKVFAFAVSACFALQPVTALAAETTGNEITMETRTRGRTVLDEIVATTNMSECIALDQPYSDPKFNSNYDLLSFWGGILYKKERDDYFSRIDPGSIVTEGTYVYVINIGAYGSGRYAISPETKFIVDGQEWVFMNGIENTSDGYMYAYYLSPEFEFSSGAPVETKSIVEENGMYYCLDEEGNRLYGFQTVDGENYYFGTEYDPTMKFGNQYIDGREYYFGEDGKTPKNQFVSPWYNTYYYDETGWPHIGWLELDSEKYYADENGIILKGVNTIDGKTYLFDRNDGGKMVRNKMAHDYYGDHYYDDDGVMQTGFVTYEGNTWYFYENGEMARNWQTIDGNTYFFGDNDGIMATGTTFIYWRYYEFDENGVLQGDI